MPEPQDTTDEAKALKRRTIGIPDPLWDGADRLGKHYGVSIGAVVRRALEELLRRENFWTEDMDPLQVADPSRRTRRNRPQPRRVDQEE